MEQVEINYKMFVMTCFKTYWLYFHSLEEAQRFAKNELRKSVFWTIHDLKKNGMAVAFSD